jgi:hypothetical protein
MSVKAAASERRRTGTLILHRGVWRSNSIGLSYEGPARAAAPRLPHTTAADSTARPQSSYETVFGASSILPLAGRSRPGGHQGIPLQGGPAAPVVEAPAGPRYDGSHADMRGAVPTYRAGVGLGRVRGSLAT